jgi:hypothetical protein
MHRQTRQVFGMRVHKYVWMLVGMITFLTAIYPIATMRVNYKENFFGPYEKPVTVHGKLKPPFIR